MDFALQLSLLFKTCLLFSLFGTGSAGFNCSRTGCTNSGICEPSGFCTCVGSIYSGYDCSQDQRYIMHGECMAYNPCKNGGTCFDNSPLGSTGTALCYCPYEFYGHHCELATVHNECYNDHMIINVNPRGTVTRVGLQHKNQFCDLQPVSSQVHFSLDPVRSQWLGYAATLPFAGTTLCGVTAKAVPMGAELTYTYDVIVRYGGQAELDEVISFSCTVPYLAGAVAGPTAVLFSVADSQGLPVQFPKVGSDITVTFNVDPSSIFTDVAVRSCSVSNAMRTISRDVVINSCPVGPMGLRLVKRGDKHVLTLRVHTFDRDPSLTFDCSVKVCTIADNTCQQLPVCSTLEMPGSGFGTGASDILSLLGMTSSGAGSGSATNSLNTLLGGSSLVGLGDLLATPGGSTTGTLGSNGVTGVTGTGDLSSSSSSSSYLSSILGASSLRDLLLSPGTTGSAGHASGRRKRRRRDVVIFGDGDDDVTDGGNVVIVRGGFL